MTFWAMKTERDEFLAFFTKMGVEHEDLRGESRTEDEERRGVVPEIEDPPDEIKHYNPRPDGYIVVGQSYFWFDRDGTFLGVEVEEVGAFEKRKD